MHFHRRTERSPGGLGKIILATGTQVRRATCELTVQQ
jgi:hypothetical protein